MENLNPCNIQRSLGEIRCLVCFVYLTLIVCFLFMYMVFLRNKNGLWLLKLTPICQGGKEAFGLIERSSSFSVKSNSSLSTSCRLGSPHSVFSVWRRELSLVSSVFSVLAKKVVQKPLPAQLCWVMSILAEVYTNV